MANETQLNILLSVNRVNEWNDYLREHPNEAIDLSGANFEGRNLSSYNFSEANFQRANLSACTLNNTNFQNADLRWSFLNWSDFRNSNCSGVNFQHSCLEEAIFTNTDIHNADFSHTNLLMTTGLSSTINCVGTKFYRSLLDCSILGNPHFDPNYISFCDSSLENNLSDIIFDQVNFDNCTFGLSRSNSTNLDFRNLICTHVTFKNCLFQNLSFSNLSFIRGSFESCRFQNVDFHNPTLFYIKIGKNITLNNCQFFNDRNIRNISRLPRSLPIFTDCSLNNRPLNNMRDLITGS